MNYLALTSNSLVSEFRALAHLLESYSIRLGVLGAAGLQNAMNQHCDEFNFAVKEVVDLRILSQEVANGDRVVLLANIVDDRDNKRCISFTVKDHATIKGTVVW